jgi:O-antigen/teichoic acid export membrane protein
MTVGIYSGMNRFFNETTDKNRLKNTALFFSIIWGGIFSLFAIIISPFIAEPLLEKRNDYIFLNYIVIISFFECLIQIYASYYAMRLEAIKSSSINLVIFAIRIVLSAYYIVVLHQGIEGLLKSHLIAVAFVLTWLFIWDFKNIKLKINLYELKEMLRFGAGLTPGQVSVWVLNLIDRYFIKELMSLQAVAFYSMGNRIGMIINPLFLVPFSKVFTPIKFSVYKEEKGRQTIKFYFDIYIFIGCLLILFLSIFSKIAILLLATNEYLHAFKVIPFIAISQFLWGLGEFYALGLHIANKMIINSALVTVSAIINVLLNIILIPFIGIYGAAISTIIAYFIANILYYRMGRKYYDTHSSIWRPYKYLIITLLFYLFYLFYQQYIDAILFEITANIFYILIFTIVLLKIGVIPEIKEKKIPELIKLGIKKLTSKNKLSN